MDRIKMAYSSRKVLPALLHRVLDPGFTDVQLLSIIFATALSDKHTLNRFLQTLPLNAEHIVH